MKVLIVVDERKRAAFFVHLMREEGYSSDVCASGAEAIKKGQSNRYSLILLDWLLRDVDGCSVCRELRRKGVSTPILMLAARRALPDRVLALEAGVDDYVLRPFEVTELLARIRVLVHCSSGRFRLRAGALKFDCIRHEVLLAGEILSLTRREYAFLLHLMHRVNQPVSRAELLTQVWDTNPNASSNLVAVMVSKLREKLKPYDWMLQTVRGSGYILRSDDDLPT